MNCVYCNNDCPPPTEARKKGAAFSRRHYSNAALEAYRAEMQRRVNDQMSAMESRHAEARERTAAQQIARLDARLGNGQGAKRERARLKKLLNA